MLEYKGYFGSAHYNDDDKVFFVKLESICPYAKESIWKNK